MATNAAIASPEPFVRTIEMVALPTMPIRTHSLPTTLHIAEKGAMSVPMMSNAPIGAPNPFRASMENVIVIVATIQVPILTNHHPSDTIPFLEDTQAVQVPADPFFASPKPTRWSIVMILFPHLPV